MAASAVLRRRPRPNFPPRPEELSNFKLLERRSRELELERARGGFGTPQPPDADTPLLVHTSLRRCQVSRNPRCLRKAVHSADGPASASVAAATGHDFCNPFLASPDHGGNNENAQGC
jgi:hypothetical protein